MITHEAAVTAPTVHDLSDEIVLELDVGDLPTNVDWPRTTACIVGDMLVLHAPKTVTQPSRRRAIALHGLINPDATPC